MSEYLWVWTHARRVTTKVTTGGAGVVMPRKTRPISNGMLRKRASLLRHSHPCKICAHKKREEIEAEFVAWESPATITRSYHLAESRFTLSTRARLWAFREAQKEHPGRIGALVGARRQKRGQFRGVLDPSWPQILPFPTRRRAHRL